MSTMSGKKWPRVQQQPLRCSAWHGDPLPSVSPSVEEEEGEEVPASFCWEIPNKAHVPTPGRTVSNGILIIRWFFS